MVQLFRDRGLKVTPQRECIFRVLDGNDMHPSAESVFVQARQRMPTMSLKTVYQTLNDLADMGEICQLDLGTGSTRFDPNVDAHHHLVCTSCGKVRDLYREFPGLSLPTRDAQGFSVGSVEVVFRGRCPDCCRSASADPKADLGNLTLDKLTLDKLTLDKSDSDNQGEKSSNG